MFKSTVLALSVFAPFVAAIISPTGPDGSSVYREGDDCEITWGPDTTGVWKVTNIELMTGDNFNMVHLKNIATIDGTDATNTSLTYPCYAVTPNSKIYFYQFSTPADSELTWTTRFTIAAADGSTVPPPNNTQPGGAAIPWGIGALEDKSLADEPPSHGNSAAGNSTTTGTSTTTVRATNTATNSNAPVEPTATVSTTRASTTRTTSSSTGTLAASTGTSSASLSHSFNGPVLVGALLIGSILFA